MWGQTFFNFFSIGKKKALRTWQQKKIENLLKILQASLQQYVNWELRDVQAGFRRGRTRDQIANIF